MNHRLLKEEYTHRDVSVLNPEFESNEVTSSSTVQDRYLFPEYQEVTEINMQSNQKMTMKEYVQMKKNGGIATKQQSLYKEHRKRQHKIFWKITPLMGLLTVIPAALFGLFTLSYFNSEFFVLLFLGLNLGGWISYPIFYTYDWRRRNLPLETAIKQGIISSIVPILGYIGIWIGYFALFLVALFYR